MIFIQFLNPGLSDYMLISRQNRVFLLNLAKYKCIFRQIQYFLYLCGEL